MKKLLKYIYPEICTLCTVNPSSENYLCTDCIRELEFTQSSDCPLCSSEVTGLLNLCHQCLENKRPWSAGGAPLKFSGTARELIHKYKYNSNLTLSRFLIGTMTEYIGDRDFPDIEWVTMVPMHWYKKFKRGFNQAEILARGISENLELPCHNLLRRKNTSSSQALKTRRQRQKNITHIFEVREKQKMPNGAILLIDDVMTTGATLAACTKALTDAGAKEVYVLTAARG